MKTPCLQIKIQQYQKGVDVARRNQFESSISLPCHRTLPTQLNGSNLFNDRSSNLSQLVRQIEAPAHVTIIIMRIMMIITLVNHNNNNDNHHLLINLVSAEHYARCLISSGILGVSGEQWLKDRQLSESFRYLLCGLEQTTYFPAPHRIPAS